MFNSKLRPTVDGYKPKSRYGFVLIEALAALSVLVIAMVGVISLLARSYKLNRLVADKYVATYLAAEGIEVVKNVIDANYIQKNPWNCGIVDGTYEVEYGDVIPAGFSCGQSFFAAGSSCTGDALYRGSNGLYSYDAVGTPTNFTRCVSVNLITSDTQNPDNEVAVSSVVNWSESDGNYSVALEDHFFNWRP